MNICIFGAASDSIDEEYKKVVYKTSKELAQMGHSLIFGAGDTGLMGAAARGFYDGQGEVYGFVPHFIVDDCVEPLFDKCTKLQYVETMNQRKEGMENSADVFLIVPGGIGTMEEFFEVLVAKSLKRHDKEIILYNIDGYYNDIINFIDNAVSNTPLNKCYNIAENFDDIVTILNRRM